MKTASNSNKKTGSKSGIVHIDPQVHKQLKIYCVIHDEDLGKYASKVLAQSLKKVRLNSFEELTED